MNAPLVTLGAQLMRRQRQLDKSLPAWHGPMLRCAGASSGIGLLSWIRECSGSALHHVCLSCTSGRPASAACRRLPSQSAQAHADVATRHASAFLTLFRLHAVRFVPESSVEEQLVSPPKRRGKGGRQRAPPPDASMDAKKAKRILANRISAAKSKEKQKRKIEVGTPSS